MFPAGILYNDLNPTPETVRQGLVWNIYQVPVGNSGFSLKRLVVLVEPKMLTSEWEHAKTATEVATTLGVDNAERVFERYGFQLVGLKNVSDNDKNRWRAIRDEFISQRSNENELTHRRLL